jgi:hypothetical protein
VRLGFSVILMGSSTVVSYLDLEGSKGEEWEQCRTVGIFSRLLTFAKARLLVMTDLK